MNEKTKISKPILSILCLALVATFARAGESVTNWVDNPAIRTVNGQTCNVNSSGWTTLSGVYQRTEKAGVIVRQWKTKISVFRTEPAITRSARTGKIIPNSGVVPGGASTQYKETIAGPLICIENFSAEGLVEGAEVNCRAMRIGKKRIGNQTLDAYDYGVSTRAQVVTSSK